MKQSYYKSFSKYILGCLLFGSNGIVASFIALDSYEIVLLHNLIGSSLLVILFFLGKEKLTFYKKKKEFLWLAISGIALGLSWMLLYTAFDRIGVSISSLLYYCGPVIVMALSPLLFKEKLTSFKVIGFLSVFCGIFLVNGNTFEGNGDAFGVLCGLLAAVMYSVMIIFNKKAEGIEGLENATLQLLMSCMTVVFLYTELLLTENLLSLWHYLSMLQYLLVFGKAVEQFQLQE